MRYPLQLATVAFGGIYSYAFSTTQASPIGSCGISRHWIRAHMHSSLFRHSVFVLPRNHRSCSSSRPPSLSSLKPLPSPRGGSRRSATDSEADTGEVETASFITGTRSILGSIWGTCGVLFIFLNAIKRLLPIALEPFQEGAVPLTQFQLGAFIVSCVWFAYFKGYKGLQQRFSPLVVKRSFTLIPDRNATKWWHFVVAPLYSMGLVNATRKRLIVSWSVTTGVAVLVAAVKRLAYPWRSIINAGVVVGLSWGSLAIAIIFVASWVKGEPPKRINAELPAVAEKQG